MKQKQPILRQFQSRDQSLLQEILSQPTAPFRESHVIHSVTRHLQESQVPYFLDPIGNIVIGASSKAEYLRLVRRKSPEPVRVFIAHMDHPGFHGHRWINDSQLEFKWHGGSPIAHLENAKVWLADAQGILPHGLGEGRLLNVQLLKSGRAIDTATVQFSQSVLPALKANKNRKPKAESIFGGFSFRAPWWIEGEQIYTKAADDLVGSFAITSLGMDLFRKKSRTEVPFLGILTRAEEVGFIGAIGHFQLGWLDSAKRPILCVSLETSRTLPGAEIGKGPIVRLGDRFTVFDSGALRVFSDLAGKILPGKFQRRIMDGGTCEASAATVFGHRSIGISVPLGNYHNQGFEGGPDSADPDGPSPEFVHLQDIQGLLQLCHGLMKPKLPWTEPWKIQRKEYGKWLRKYQPLLKI